METEKLFLVFNKIRKIGCGTLVAPKIQFTLSNALPVIDSHPQKKISFSNQRQEYLHLEHRQKSHGALWCSLETEGPNLFSLFFQLNRKMCCYQKVFPFKADNRLTRQAGLTWDDHSGLCLYQESWWVCFSWDSLKPFLAVPTCLGSGDILCAVLTTLGYQCKLCDGRDCLIPATVLMSRILSGMILSEQFLIKREGEEEGRKKRQKAQRKTKSLQPTKYQIAPFPSLHESLLLLHLQNLTLLQSALLINKYRDTQSQIAPAFCQHSIRANPASLDLSTITQPQPKSYDRSSLTPSY